MKKQILKALKEELKRAEDKEKMAGEMLREHLSPGNAEYYNAKGTEVNIWKIAIKTVQRTEKS